MADLSGYQSDMDYCQTQANSGSLTTDNGIYKSLKAKAGNLPELQRWLTSNIETKIKHV